ncbi:type I toxin-antitoxin system Hok family toxin [Cronobacter muytjensii]
MKLLRSTLFWCVVTLCITLLVFTFLTRHSLCELRLKDGQREFAAFLAYQSDK